MGAAEKLLLRAFDEFKIEVHVVSIYWITAGLQELQRYDLGHACMPRYRSLDCQYGRGSR